jgi:phosphoribosylanthranilate isomerase
MSKIIVTGGRNYCDYIMLEEVLDIIKPTLIIQGGASGADLIAKEYAEYKELPVITFDADWEQHGKAAGPMRNIQMLEAHPDAVVVAFPGGIGTSNCVKEAIKRNMIVLEVK